VIFNRWILELGNSSCYHRSFRLARSNHADHIGVSSERSSRERPAALLKQTARNLVSALTGANFAPPRGVGRPRSPKNFRPINFKSNLCRVRYVRIERTPNSALAKYWTYYARTHIHTQRPARTGRVGVELYRARARASATRLPPP